MFFNKALRMLAQFFLAKRPKRQIAPERWTPANICVHYADRAAERVASAGSAFPVVIQQVDSGGTPISGSSAETINDEKELEALGRRLDNIVPGGRWGLWFAQT